MRVRRPLALVYSRRPVSSIRAPCAADLTAQRQAATKESSTTFASITLRLRVHDSARFTSHFAQLLWCRTSSETGNAVMRMLGHATRLALLAVLDASCALNLVEMKPLAAAMLAKRWATDQAELDQKVGIRDDGVTGVLRFGDDLRRRTEVAKTYDIFQKTSLALAAAAKGGGGATVCYAGHDPSGNQGHASSWR